jgi:hypothetical protein
LGTYSSAVSISFIHTASGRSLSALYCDVKIQKWSRSKPLLTIACGFGHVLSSLAIGAAGVFLGWQLNRFSWFQELGAIFPDGHYLFLDVHTLFMD